MGSGNVYEKNPQGESPLTMPFLSHMRNIQTLRKCIIPKIAVLVTLNERYLLGMS